MLGNCPYISSFINEIQNSLHPTIDKSRIERVIQHIKEQAIFDENNGEITSGDDYRSNNNI
jgi:hypothetical protein